MWFFFFKQKTAYEMRISDWSSDVCSSDLLTDGLGKITHLPRIDARYRQTGHIERVQRRLLITSCGLQQDLPRIEGLQPRDQLCKARRVVGEALHRLMTVDRHIQERLAPIPTCEIGRASFRERACTE